MLSAGLCSNLLALEIHNQCVISESKREVVFIEVSQRDSGYIIHGELALRKFSNGAFRYSAILPHIAISEKAYGSACKKDKFIAALYPETYLYGYRKWLLMKIDSQATYICNGTLENCIDSTKIFDRRASLHWNDVFNNDRLKLKLLGCLEFPCSDRYIESLKITRIQADSILKQATLSPESPPVK
jgi:hypothetical protein